MQDFEPLQFPQKIIRLLSFRWDDYYKCSDRYSAGFYKAFEGHCEEYNDPDNPEDIPTLINDDIRKHVQSITSQAIAKKKLTLLQKVLKDWLEKTPTLLVTELCHSISPRKRQRTNFCANIQSQFNNFLDKVQPFLQFHSKYPIGSPKALLQKLREFGLLNLSDKTDEYNLLMALRRCVNTNGTLLLLKLLEKQLHENEGKSLRALLFQISSPKTTEEFFSK